MMSVAEKRATVALPDDPGQLPRHVAIIMDGNGRWASGRGLPRSEGHRRGVEAVRRTVRAAIELHIGYLTLFSFSSENWSRPQDEVEFLLGLFRHYIRRDVAQLNEMGVRIEVIGDREGLPADILALIAEAEGLTAGNRNLRLAFAFNYGSRNEIRRAVRAIGREVRDGTLDPEDIDETVIESHLDTAAMPNPDLVIRTSGEYRLSNFLLWQAAYAELVFLPLYWPDFNQETFKSAVDEYSTRIRRYGGIGRLGGG
jgi:undecaprenyl diphosphate synthase